MTGLPGTQAGVTPGIVNSPAHREERVSCFAFGILRPYRLLGLPEVEDEQHWSSTTRTST